MPVCWWRLSAPFARIWLIVPLSGMYRLLALFGSIAGDVQLFVVNGCFYFKQAENGVEEVVMGKALRGFVAERLFVNLETVAKPEDRGNVLLAVRGAMAYGNPCK